MLGGYGEGTVCNFRVERTGEEVKKKWVYLESEAKGLAAGKKKSLKMTGGGRAEDGDIYGVDSRILNVIGKVCLEGVEGGVDTADVHLETTVITPVYDDVGRRSVYQNVRMFIRSKTDILCA